VVDSLSHQLLSALWSFGSFLVAIIVLVTVHEFGHFWVARKVGVRVLRFSVGFGKPLLSWCDKSGCEYVIASIPFGGYIKMLDEREDPVATEDLPFSFSRQPVWKRSAIVVAGPVANLLLALLTFWVLFAGGEQGYVPLVDKVMPSSIAAASGLVSGQEIVSVDGVNTPTRTAVYEALLARVGDTGELAMGVRHPGDDITYELLIDLRRWLSDSEEPDPVAALGIHFYLPPFVLVNSVLPGSPAELAGFKPADVIERMDGKPVADVEAWLSDVRNSPGRSLVMSVRREGVVVDISVVPARATDKEGKAIGQIGAQISSPPLDSQHIRKIDYSFIQSFVRSVDETGKQMRLLVLSIYKLVIGNLSPKNLSGPLGIAKVAGASADRGLVAFCHMLAILSISLGVMNLLPIPMLDGGHLLMYLIEAAKGSPVAEKIQIVGNQIGLAMIVSLMLFAVYNDFLKF
jgi:regulator of sigma E protease